MFGAKEYDAIVVGSGPNSLAAAITLARSKRSVLVVEARETIGGGCRTAEVTLPGFHHDICSAVHPLAIGSPFFKRLPLENYGLEWIMPPLSVAHPLDGGQAVAVYHSVHQTAEGLGPDKTAYLRLMEPFVKKWDELAKAFLGPLRPPADPLLMARFGLSAIRSAVGLANSTFKTGAARAMFLGFGCHSIMPLDDSPTAAFALMLGITAHKPGWGFPRGGAQQIVDAMAEYLRDLGGEIVTGFEVKSLGDLPRAKAVLLGLTPRQVLALASDRLPENYRNQLAHFKYGPGVFKIDYALSGPVPWQAKECWDASTVHVGGSADEVAYSEHRVGGGKVSDRPFVLVSQPSVFDPTRAPAGKHVLWAYCHVPNGCDIDMTERIERQIERFAPGFRDLILARHIHNPARMEEYNPNYVGGDINGGMQNWSQLFTRPAISLNPYVTPDKRLFICSSSTPPGGGVHGMCGFWAAKAALNSVLA